jgi:hypothetical protein
MLLIQLFGFVGILLIIASFQFNKRKIILRIQTLSAIAWAAHYLLLGAFTGGGVSIWSAGRNLLFERYRHKQWLLHASLASISIICLVTWKDWTTILPIIGCVFTSLAMWQKDPVYIRILCLFMVPPWFAYNFINGSIPGMIGDMINLGSVLSGMIRFDLLPRLQSSKPVFQEVEPAYDVAE